MRYTLIPILVLLYSSGCKHELAAPSEIDILNNSRWKVYSTTWEFPDGYTESFGFNTSGYYLNLNKDSRFLQTHYPYTYNSTGNWIYTKNRNELLLQYNAGGSPFESAFTILHLAKDKLVLYNENSLSGGGGFVKCTYILQPY